MKQLTYGTQNIIDTAHISLYYHIVPARQALQKSGETFMPKAKSKVLHCCEKCQNYWTCETKWYRGERGEESICCPLCGFHHVCWEKCPQNKKKKA